MKKPLKLSEYKETITEGIGDKLIFNLVKLMLSGKAKKIEKEVEVHNKDLHKAAVELEKATKKLKDMINEPENMKLLKDLDLYDVLNRDI